MTKAESLVPIVSDAAVDTRASPGFILLMGQGISRLGAQSRAALPHWLQAKWLGQPFVQQQAGQHFPLLPLQYVSQVDYHKSQSGLSLRQDDRRVGANSDIAAVWHPICAGLTGGSVT